VIRCKITEARALADCIVVSEAPQGAGLGDAALQMSSKFRMKLQTKDGQSTAGATIDIPIVLKLAPP